MVTLANLESFVRAAEGGSFSAAARKLGLTAAAVSRNVEAKQYPLIDAQSSGYLAPISNSTWSDIMKAIVATHLASTLRYMPRVLGRACG